MSAVTASGPAVEPVDLDADASRGLRRLNLGVGLVHAAQAAILLLVASSADLPVEVSYLEGPPGSGERGGPASLFDLPIAAAVAAFLALAAVDHLLVGGPLRTRYEGWLREGRNPARWNEYAVSASLMVVLIAMLAGTTEATALVAIFGACAAMIWFGKDMEERNPPGSREVDWRPFRRGCYAGAVPWIAIAIQIAVANAEADVPTFVIGIFVSLFVLFNGFAVNMWLHYRRVGRWADPLHAERAYIVLSLTAKSALAWQVYGGALAGS